MKEKIRNILLQILSVTVTAILCLGAWGAGLFLSFKGYMHVNRPLWIAICSVSAGIVLLLFIINAIGAKRLTNKFSTMKMREIYNWGESLKSDVESNFKRTERSVRLTLALAYCYIIAVILLMPVCCFGTGVLLHGEDNMAYIAIIIIPILFTMWGLVDVFFTPLTNPAPPALYLLDEKKFPLIYSTVREAAAISGCRLKVSIYICGEGASVSAYGRTAIICLNYLYGALLTRDELFNVMLHEFAHIANADVKRSKTFAHAEQRFDSNGGNVIIDWGRLLTTLVSVAVIFKTNIYSTFASRYHEIEADKALKKLGDPQKSIDALAKTGMVGLFGSVPHRELDYDFFAPEQTTGDYAAQELALFLKHRELYGDKWRARLEKELPARVDSHPTFRNRMTALECDSYDPCRTESDPAYAAEQKEVIAAADRIMNEENKANYGEIRKNAYVERKKVIDEYFEAEKNGGEIADNKLYDYIQAFMGVDDDIALALADRAASLPEPTIANYYKAIILFNRDDDGCIECLKAVAASTDNMDWALEATDRLGLYALKTGNEELLKEYRSTSPEVVQASRDKDERNRINKNSAVTECDLDGEIIKSVLDGIDKDLLNGISAIHIGTYTDSDGAKHYPVVLTFKGRDRAKNFEIMNGVYEHLFGFSSKYDFILVPSFLYRKVKKCGSCVYENKN